MADLAIRLCVEGATIVATVWEYPPPADGRYAVVRTRGTVALPQSRRAEIEQLSAEVLAAATRGGSGGECLADMQALGALLREVMFPGDVRVTLLDAVLASYASGERCRLRLAAEDFLDAWPFEFTYIPEIFPEARADLAFLSLSTRISFVRDPGLKAVVMPLDVSEDLRVLLVACQPAHGDAEFEELPGIAGERTRMLSALRHPSTGPAIRVVELVDGTPQQVLATLSVERPQVFVFLGHADAEHGLVLRDHGSGRFLGSDSLAQALRAAGTRLAVCDACWTGTSAGPILSRAGVPAVVAMSGRVDDLSAQYFGQAFWQALASRLRIDDCLITAREHIRKVIGDRRADWGVPRLYLTAPTPEVLALDEDPWLVKFFVAARRDYETWRASATLGKYSEVHVHPDSIFLVPQEREIIAGRRRFERYTVKDAVAHFNPLLIVGEPGTGKTTALRELTNHLLGEVAGTDRLLPLFTPVFPVRHASSDPTGIGEELLRAALKRIHPSWGSSATEFWRHLERYPFAIVFDGLNEIAEELIPSYCASIAAVTQKIAQISPRSRVVISSRIDNLTRAIDAVRRMTKHIFEVQKLTDEARLHEFVAAQLGSPGDRSRFLALLADRLSLRPMAQNPFLLTAMIALFERSGEVPESRGVVLRGLAELMLGGFGTEDPIRGQLHHKILADLALELRIQGAGLGAPRATVEAIIQRSLKRHASSDLAARLFIHMSAQTVIDDLVNKRLLTVDWWYFDGEAETPGVRFWLEPIQEYFAASLVVETLVEVYDRSLRGVVRKRARDRLGGYISANEWHHVLGIAIGLAPPEIARQAFREVCRRAPLVAAVCIAGGLKEDQDLFLRGTDSRVRAIVKASVAFSGLHIAIVGCIAFLAFWAALGTFDGGWPVGQVTLADLLPLALRLGSLLVLFGTSTLLSWFEKVENLVCDRLLPNQFIQPLLRALITAGTEESVRVLSRLETDCHDDHLISSAMRGYIAQANRIWRFHIEQVATLLVVLDDSRHADYAIDRLEQRGDVSALRPLLEAVKKLPGASAARAVRAAVRLCLGAGVDQRPDTLERLRAIQADRTLPLGIRVAAFRGRRELGDAGASPPLLYYLYKLIPRGRSMMIIVMLLGLAMTTAALLVHQKVQT